MSAGKTKLWLWKAMQKRLTDKEGTPWAGYGFWPCCSRRALPLGLGRGGVGCCTATSGACLRRQVGVAACPMRQHCEHAAPQ
jgi:hypothetical protein